ncbi:hypothetical protein [Legionella sp. PC997]|uniref:hypothetical protein n=1 Tax=Legionella sp. PC997 TaxID=2755562 RepID=UPI0015F88515|nr:hypothetical protein [Legionella sp. PC997]QMT59950.1 hypothetical protein HBNCFIEN_01319 [Legionella sp. PC997]
MQSKSEELSSKVAANSLYAARLAINISNAAKHIFFPIPEEANVPFKDRMQVQFEQKALPIAEDLTSITIGK